MPVQTQKIKTKLIQLEVSEFASLRLEQSARRLGISVEEAASALLEQLGTSPSPSPSSRKINDSSQTS